MARKISDSWANADAITQHVLEEYLHHYGYDAHLQVQKYLASRRRHMASNKVMLPDGTEQNASDLICEGCEKSLAEHSCGGSVTITTGAAPVRSSAPRKAAADIIPCPHCQGRMHMNLPAATVNFECFMRQYWTDTGAITDPLTQRLPVWTIDDLKNAVAWSETLSTPITYGKMESAAGGSGTYASTRPKAPPKEKSERPKKRKAAEAGERIEDLAAEVADENDDMDLGSISEEAPAEGSKRKRSRKGKDLKVTPTVTGEDFSAGVITLEDAAAEAYEGPTEEPPVEEPAIDLEAERERKRAERRRILSGAV
jgi:hypothetical protein